MRRASCARRPCIDGRRLVLTGSAWGLFGIWIKRFLLGGNTADIYLFWVGPRNVRWTWERANFDPVAAPVAPAALQWLRLRVHGLAVSPRPRASTADDVTV